MIVSFLNQKGGVGKTTISFNVAFELSQRGKKVLFVDSDLQGSASLINSAREDSLGFPVISIATPSINKEIEKFKSQYDYIIIDGLPSISKITQSTIIISDLIVVPMQPSGVDIWATQSLVDLIDASSVINPNVIVGIVMNRFDGNRILNKSVLEKIEESNWQIFDTTIGNRTSFQKSTTYGQAVAEIDKGGKADLEIKNLVNEIQQLEQ